MKKLRRETLHLLMKVQWKFITYYDKRMNYIVKKGIKLNKSKLIKMNFKQDKHIVRVMKLKEQFEITTGESFKYFCQVKYNPTNIL